MRMYSKLVYAKFYVLDFLAKSSDKSSAIVLMDTDALVLDSFEDLTKLDVDYSARVGLYNEINVRKYFDKKGISVDLRENPKCNGGFYYFNKKVLRNKDLNTKKCFEILSFLINNDIKCYYDEVVFSIIGKLFNLSFKNASELGYNAVPAFYDNLNFNTKLIHAVRYPKFWKDEASFLCFKEWFVNYKIWIKTYKGNEKFSYPTSPISHIKDDRDLFVFLSLYKKMNSLL